MTATILIPTRGRPGYLDVTLASVAPQAAAAGAEMLVVDDGADPATARVAQRHGARVLGTAGGAGSAGSAGANAARNRGVDASQGDPVVFIDDDIRAGERWLAALLAGVTAGADYEVFGGPIRAAIEGGGPHSCGREAAPITVLDLGGADRDAEFVWSANMAVRRAALERVGPFDESIQGRGEEEDWERRYRAGGGRIRYLALAGVEHRRVGADARLGSLSRAAYALGRTARHYDVRKGSAPAPAAELVTVVRSLGHVARFGCPNMLPGAAHAAGRLREAVAR
jgi:glycosyltransferase involved in cell wall biosynthesis